MPQHPDDDDGESHILPIPLDRETRKNLHRLAEAIGRPPINVATELLRDVLKDDAMHNAGIPTSPLN